MQGENVICEEEKSDQDGLRDFNAVDAREDVDAVRAENGDGGHVGVVKPADVDECAEIGFELDGYGDVGHVIIDEVDDEHWDGGKGGDEEFVAPADVEEVVADTEDYDGLEREYGG